MGTLYKVLNEDGSSMHGGRHKWSLPRGKRAGKWTPSIDPRPCWQGWHLCKGSQLFRWLGPTIWVAEARGKIVRQDDKVVCESVRLVAPTAWDERAARLLAVDCAARVSHLMEDERSREALRVARAFANGEATEAELKEAARAADAAIDAAIDAAYAAAEAARAADAAANAAIDAASNAARAAYVANAAANAAYAARAAYVANAAAGYAAARAAGYGAAKAAANAARAAGYAAAGYAAAHKAERKWQQRRLLCYLKGLPCKPVPIK